MTEKIILVTPPDDIYLDANRLLLVNLNPEHTQFISDALNKLTKIYTTVIYIWENGNGFEWLADKKSKSDMIIFNSSDQNELLTGYLSADPRSHYFGELRDLHVFNKKQILDIEQLSQILEISFSKMLDM